MIPQTMYVSIGNSDNKLTQKLWHDFCDHVERYVKAYAYKIHSVTFSLPNAPWQNAVFCFDVTQKVHANYLLGLFEEIASMYNQDAIAVTVVQATAVKMVKPLESR